MRKIIINKEILTHTSTHFKMIHRKLNMIGRHSPDAAFCTVGKLDCIVFKCKRHSLLVSLFSSLVTYTLCKRQTFTFNTFI